MRAAQVVADSKFGGVPVLFTWPSKSQLFGYVSDKDSATASRDALQDLLTDIAATPGVGKIHVLAHSMGGWVAMEALAAGSALRPSRSRRTSRRRDARLAGRRSRRLRLADGQNPARESHRVRDAERSRAFPLERHRRIPSAGRRDRSLANPADKAKIEELGAKVYDLSKYSDGFIDHGAYAVTPDVLHAIGAEMATPRAGETDTVSVIDAKAYADKPEN